MDMSGETTKEYLEKLLKQALKTLGFNLAELGVTVPVSNYGDYATNAALVLAKINKENPKDIAKKIIDEILKADIQGFFEEVSEAGGFINFKLSAKYLISNLHNILEQKELFGVSLNGQGKTVVVEYFQNNVAKPPHVGHLRSAVIGDCLLRVLRAQGYKAVSDTHIGDWGVQFGILLFAYKEFIKAGGDKKQIEADPINELNKLYVGMSAKIEVDEAFRNLGKEEFIKLEKGDRENRQLWQWFVDESLQDFERYRKLLGLLPFDYNLGESFYEEHMPQVIKEFEKKGILKTGDDGEKYVDLEKYGLGRCIIVKSDGGTTYHTRDFACYIYRRKEFGFYKNIYVVDNRQSHHFKQLFKVLELAGYPATEDSLHVELGFMSLPEGAISTRKGTTVSLKNLIDEAKERALKIIQEKNSGLKNKEAVARLVGLSAIKYFDLSHNRKTEIVFTWDKALSFEGNTGPYLQYTHARICGILRKAYSSGRHPEQSEGSYQTVDSSALPQNDFFDTYEVSVLRKLIKYPEIVAQVAEDFLPNILCNYLFELSQIFNAFYQEVPVLQEQDHQIRDFRLQLITATAQVLVNGLYLLGIEAPEEM